MHALVINLERSSDRRIHMKETLSGISGLSYEFVAAVDGQQMSEAELDAKFDRKKSERYCAKKITRAEVGCTLSHQKCYRMIVERKMDFALILEDDILIKDPHFAKKIPALEKLMETEKPLIVLLSGLYWWVAKREVCNGGGYIADVWAGYLSSAYIINKAAAQVLIQERPFMRADDWRFVRKKMGVKIIGAYPHLINQDWSGNFASTIYEHNPFLRGHFVKKLLLIIFRARRRVLKALGRFEPAE